MIYVACDKITKTFSKYYMWGDSAKELHDFAKRINVDGNNFNGLRDIPYYNLKKEKKMKSALINGAVKIEIKDIPDIFKIK